MNIQDLKKINQGRLVKAQEVVRKQDTFIALAEKISTGLDKVDPKQFKSVSDALKELSVQIKSLPNALDKMNAKDSQDMMDCMRSIEKAVNSKDFSPTIDVKSPTIPKIDISPITRAIESLKETEDMGVDLDDYRGIVIDDESDTMQYIGFMNPKGEWYIACNDMGENRMLYVFGKSNFSNAWDSHMSLAYKMLDTAIAEVYSEVSA